MTINNQIEVTVGKATRSVSVNIASSTFSSGYVGRAYFCWDSDKYDLPYVRLKGKTADDRTRKLVKLFLDAYHAMLKEEKVSPLHFKESEKVGSSSSSSKQESISGVPLWMREDHKVWTKCYREDGSFYLRRTRFKPESKEIVENYLPSCAGCVFRVNCDNPCDDPEVRSQSSAFEHKEIKMSV